MTCDFALTCDCDCERLDLTQAALRLRLRDATHSASNMYISVGGITTQLYHPEGQHRLLTGALRAARSILL